MALEKTLIALGAEAVSNSLVTETARDWNLRGTFGHNCTLLCNTIKVNLRAVSRLPLSICWWLHATFPSVEYRMHEMRNLTWSSAVTGGMLLEIFCERLCNLRCRQRSRQDPG